MLGIAEISLRSLVIARLKLCVIQPYLLFKVLFSYSHTDMKIDFPYALRLNGWNGFLGFTGAGKSPELYFISTTATHPHEISEWIHAHFPLRMCMWILESVRAYFSLYVCCRLSVCKYTQFIHCDYENFHKNYFSWWIPELCCTTNWHYKMHSWFNYSFINIHRFNHDIRKYSLFYWILLLLKRFKADVFELTI